jgi:hypothetical protein
MFSYCCLRNALLQNEFDGTEGGNIWIISDLDCLDYRVTIEESLHSGCETGCTSEKDSKQICLLSNLALCFYLLVHRSPVFKHLLFLL